MPTARLPTICGMALFAVLVSLSNAAVAQQNTLFGTTGPANGRNGFGNSISSASAAFGNNPALSAPRTSTAGGSLQNTMRQAGALGGTANQGMGAGTNALGGTNQNGFVGQAGQGNFVGQSQFGGQQGAGGQFGQSNQFNQGNRGGNNRGGANNRGNNNRGQNNQNGFNQNGFNQQAGGGNGALQQRQIRPQLRIGFNVVPPAASTTHAGLTTRFEQLEQRFSARGGFKGVTATGTGNTVTLRGEVGTEDERRLAGILAGMEPGVRTVQNELTVLTPETTANAPE